MKKKLLLASILFSISFSFGYTTFDISQGLAPGSSNALGLAVDPDNGHTFISTLSYEGQDNLYEFDSIGNLVYSARIPFDVGGSGNIGEMVMSNDGHLFMAASRYNGNSWDNYLLETSKDGQTIYQTLEHPGSSGISYNPLTDSLSYIKFLSERNYTVKEVTREGNLISKFRLDEPIAGRDWYVGLIYDSITEDFYINEFRQNVLSQYSKNDQGDYEYALSYDINTLPLLGTIHDIDINRATGLFYAQDDNEQVIIFNIDELDVYPIPEPATLLLLGVGGLLIRKR